MDCHIDIPSDILVLIFHKLPVRSILKCKCVCKSWYSLIKNPFFVATNLNNTLLSSINNPNPNKQLFLVCSEIDGSKNFSIYVDCDGEFKEHMKLNPPFESSCFDINFHNGLVCLFKPIFEYDGNYCLWNPLIDKYFIVPPAPITLYSYYVDGFGFDCVGNDYKLLQITVTLYEDIKDVRLSVDLFSVKQGCWSSLEDSIAPDIKLLYHGSQKFVSVRGVMHGIAFRQKMGDITVHSMYEDIRMRREVHNVLLGFDIGREVFREIMLPYGFRNTFNVEVEVYKSSSIMLLSNYWDFAEIWVMKEYGIVESWIKFTLTTFTPCGCRILEWRNNGTLLFESLEGYYSLDPNRENRDEYEKEYHDQILRKSLFSFIKPYTESLALFDIV